jgi:hypothetical protein
VYVVALAATLGLAERARDGVRVPRGAATGRAAAALGDSGAFAPRALGAPPPGVRPVIARADAESAAVAFAYHFGPSAPVVRGGRYEERPTERRRVCGRAYYVRPVVAVPAAVAAAAVDADLTMAWGPTWVVPVCDDGGFARTTVLLTDAPTRLRVVLGDRPDDVPELVYPTDRSARIGSVPGPLSLDWERGVALTPEAAVAVATTAIAGAGARVAEVPEAFALVIPPDRLPQPPIVPQSMPQTPACPRWRLTLDRPVTLRGAGSGQRVRTRTVYVARGDFGCSGAATLQIPRPDQPTTLPFLYDARALAPAATSAPAPSFVAPAFPTPAPPPPAPAPGTHRATPPPVEDRWTALRVTEPVWFEEARPSR